MLTRERLLVWMVFLVCLTCCESREEITVVFGGDVMLDRGIRIGIESKGFHHLTASIEDELSKADFGIVNLECPATNINSPLHKKYVFRANPVYLSDLRDAGITHCILANNHSYDQGREGLISTAANLKQANLGSIGFGVDQQSACAPVLINKNDVSVAIFSSVVLPLESWIYAENKPGMCQATIEDLCRQISDFRKEHPTVHIVVTLHWGVEYQNTPTSHQREQAKQLVAAGADAIIGHHPHVIQSFEEIEGKPVFYSMGNLIFDNKNIKTHEGILVKLIMRKDQIKVKAIPYRSHDNVPVVMDEAAVRELFARWQKISDPLNSLVPM